MLRYQPMAQKIAKRIVGNEDLAQELVQDSMLQAYLSLEKLRDPKSFKSWLYGIVLNVCRNNLRRRKIISFSLETMIGDFGIEPLSIDKSSLDPQKILEQRELYTALLQAIDSLSDSNRLATILFYQEQLSLQEVANRLDISVGAVTDYSALNGRRRHGPLVKGRLHKARHQLRKQLLPFENKMQPISSQEQKIMNTNTAAETKQKFNCSFCYKSKEQVNFLIAGPLLENACVYICDECVDKCKKIISEAKHTSP